jgi:hypothetical protein
MLGLDVISFSISMSLLLLCLLVFNKIYIYIYIYIYWGENAKFLFFLLIVFQILYMFLSDISVHCALIEYAYIRLRVYV